MSADGARFRTKPHQTKPNLTAPYQTGPHRTRPDRSRPYLTKPDLTPPNLAKPYLTKTNALIKLRFQPLEIVLRERCHSVGDNLLYHIPLPLFEAQLEWLLHPSLRSGSLFESTTSIYLNDLLRA